MFRIMTREIKVRYTDAHIRKVLDEKYFPRIDRVMEVLRLTPLNQNGIYRVANISSDFQVINNVRQQNVGRALVGSIEDEIVVCRELILSRNPNQPEDMPLVHIFAGIPLEVQTTPFFFAAYDNPTFDYVVEHARTEQKYKKSRVMRTDKRVPFMLAKEADINQTFPNIIRWGEISVLFKRE